MNQQQKRVNRELMLLIYSSLIDTCQDTPSINFAYGCSQLTPRTSALATREQAHRGTSEKGRGPAHCSEAHTSRPASGNDAPRRGLLCIAGKALDGEPPC